MSMPGLGRAVLLASAGAVLPHGAARAATKPPALYTAAQATEGAAKYDDDCSQCHGPHLEGRSGPALKGPNFASVKAAYKVSDIFNFALQNMPATQPGSLPQPEYVVIMAFLLQQNGYPAGTKQLTYSIASTSKVPLLYQGP